MPRTRDADHNDYVQCEECGCPVEGHDRNGCQNLGGECPCRVPWTAAEIRKARREDFPHGGPPRTRRESEGNHDENHVVRGAVLTVHMDTADFERLRKDWSPRHPGMLRTVGRFTAGPGRKLDADWDWSEVHYFGEDYAALLLGRAFIARNGFRCEVAYDNHGDSEGLPNGWCILTDYEEQR